MIPGLPELLDELLGCAEREVDPPAARVFLAPGLEVAWDACCDGQLWVRVVGVADGSDRVPVVPRLADGSSCAPPAWVVTLGVGVLRCTPVVDDRGRAPSADALTGSAGQVLEDMAAVAGAVVCCSGLSGVGGMLWTPLGPEGGCAGGEWTFDVVLRGCGCDEIGEAL